MFSIFKILSYQTDCLVLKCNGYNALLKKDKNNMTVHVKILIKGFSNDINTDIVYLLVVFDTSAKEADSIAQLAFTYGKQQNKYDTCELVINAL